MRGLTTCPLLKFVPIAAALGLVILTAAFAPAVPIVNLEGPHTPFFLPPRTSDGR